MPDETLTTIRGRTNQRRLWARAMKYCSIFWATSKSAMTPSFSGRMATIVPGVRPSMALASWPTASTELSAWRRETMEGSFSTMPSPWTKTSVLAVPRSTARSRENIPPNLANIITSPLGRIDPRSETSPTSRTPPAEVESATSARAGLVCARRAGPCGPPRGREGVASGGEERELLGLGPRGAWSRSAIGQSSGGAQPSDELKRRLGLAPGQVGAVREEPLVALAFLGPVAGQMLEKVLARARAQVHHVGPEMEGARLARGAHHGSQLFGTVGDAGEDGRHAHASPDAGRGERAQGSKPLVGMGRAGLGAT